MGVQLHPSFLDSYAKLQPGEQAKTQSCLNSLMSNPESPGLRLHKLEHSSGHVFSVSPDMDLRIIVVRRGRDFIAVHVDHHDPAYAWIKNRRVLLDEACGIFEIVPELQRSSESQKVRGSAETSLTRALAARDFPASIVSLFYGVVGEGETLDLIQHLSPELQELVFDVLAHDTAPAFSGVDVPVVAINDDHELAAALQFPIDKWRVFLHPKQERIVSAGTSERIAVFGGPGTGKTVVLLHRALRALARGGRGESTAVFITHSRSLAEGVIRLLGRLDPEASDQVTIMTNEHFVDTKKRLHNGKWYLSNRRVLHLLVDELQDAGNDVLNQLRLIAGTTSCGMTVSCDLNQSIVRGTKAQLDKVLDDFRFRRTELTYSYRIIRQLADFLADRRRHVNLLPAVAPRMADPRTSSVVAGLSGPEVTIMVGAAAAEEAMAGLRLRYGPEEMFITSLVRGRTNVPRRLQYYDSEIAERHGTFYRSPFDLKGLEYFAGVVVSPGDLLDFTASRLKRDFVTLTLPLSDAAHRKIRKVAAEEFPEKLKVRQQSGKVTVTWRTEMTVAEHQRFKGATKGARGLEPLPDILKRKANQGYEELGKAELFRLNLLHVAVSRVREVAVVVRV
jgi:hypothetical protein